MKHQQPAPGSLAWARGMAITGAVAAGMYLLYPLALGLRALWRWS
ncbi:hypothetical protein LJR066_005730 [Acidovorax sp. LjRoot66]